MSSTSTRLPLAGLQKDLAEALERRLAQGAVDLPTLPSKSRELLNLRTSDEDFDPALLARTIESDPALSAQILRIANSVFFAPKAPIVSLQQAIGRLGSKRVREIVILVSVKSDGFSKSEWPELVQPMFRRAVAASLFAQEVARQKRLAVDEAFLCGLFHNLGEPALLSEVCHLARQMKIEVDVAAAAEAAKSASPAVGAQILTAWKLSPRLAEAVLFHRDPKAAPAAKEAAAFAALGADAAESVLTRPSEPLSKVMVGHPAADVLDLYPEDLAALDQAREGILGLLETIS